MEAEKNPNGRTGIVGIGSLINFGPNRASCIFIVSEKYFIVTAGREDYEIPVEYCSAIDPESKIYKLRKLGVSITDIRKEIQFDSEYNTGLFQNIIKKLFAKKCWCRNSESEYQMVIGYYF